MKLNDIMLLLKFNVSQCIVSSQMLGGIISSNFLVAYRLTLYFIRPIL